MSRVTFRLDPLDHKILKGLARQHQQTLSEEIRQVIKKGLIIDAPKRIQQVQTACTIEAVLILRKLATRQDTRIVDEAYDEAHQLIDKLFEAQL